MTINLHIGMPHLLPNLIHEISKSVVVTPDEMATVISRGEWRSHFRPALSQKRKKILDMASMPALQGAYTGADRTNISISQHTFLGKGVDLFSPDYSMRDFVGKLERLLSLFEGQQINIHVLIKDQYEYLKNLDKVSLDCVLQSGQICSPSWSDVVSALRISAPNAKLVVWDCEEENKVAFAFATWMLEFANDRVMSDVYDFMEIYMRKISERQRKRELTVPRSISEKLDLRYSLDCDAISRMKDVVFVEKDKVPKALNITI